MPLNPFGKISLEVDKVDSKTQSRNTQLSAQEAIKHGFVIVDVETTGVFPKRDRVLEIAIIRCASDLVIEDVYSWLSRFRVR